MWASANSHLLLLTGSVSQNRSHQGAGKASKEINRLMKFYKKIKKHLKKIAISTDFLQGEIQCTSTLTLSRSLALSRSTQRSKKFHFDTFWKCDAVWMQSEFKQDTICCRKTRAPPFSSSRMSNVLTVQNKPRKCNRGILKAHSRVMNLILKAFMSRVYYYISFKD